MIMIQFSWRFINASELLLLTQKVHTSIDNINLIYFTQLLLWVMSSLCLKRDRRNGWCVVQFISRFINGSDIYFSWLKKCVKGICLHVFIFLTQLHDKLPKYAKKKLDIGLRDILLDSKKRLEIGSKLALMC